MRSCLALLILATVAVGSSQTTLGDFVFDDARFGTTLIESDAGSFSFSNWLNVMHADPGNPGYLTGVGFDTGIANIGAGGIQPVYTIGYGAPIVNVAGADLGIVVARYTEDDIALAVSSNGVNFTSDVNFGPATAADTGIHKLYYYGGGGPFDAELFVQSVDLSDFGIALGDSILATRVTGSPQLDLIRVAGFLPVPEPASVVVIGLAFGLWARRRRS